MKPIELTPKTRQEVLAHFPDKTLKLQARDFIKRGKWNSWSFTSCCPIAKAVQRVLGNYEVREHVLRFEVCDTVIFHECYPYYEWISDQGTVLNQLKGKKLTNPSKVIRTISLHIKN